MTSATLNAASINELAAEPVARLQQLHNKFVANPTAANAAAVTRIPTELGMRLPLADDTLVEVDDNTSVHALSRACVNNCRPATYTIAELRNRSFCGRCGHVIVANLPIAAFGQIEEAVDVLAGTHPPMDPLQRDAVTLLPVFGYGIRSLQQHDNGQSPLERAVMRRKFYLNSEPLLAQLLNDQARADALTRWENTHMR